MDVGSTHLKTKHRITDFLYWNLMLAIPLVAAGAAIYRHSGMGLIAYLLALVIAVSLAYRFFCTHCPHYISSGGTVKCLFFWGMPRVFDPRPGPLSATDKLLSFTALGIVVFFPMPWLVMEGALFAIFLMSLIAFGVTMRKTECGRCIYSDCPANCAGNGALDT
jgi:hypothetical protein